MSLYSLFFCLSSADIVNVTVEPAAAGRARGRSRSRNAIAPGSSNVTPGQNVNAVIVQKVSDLAAAVTSQSAQMRESSDKVTRLTETVASLADTFSRVLNERDFRDGFHRDDGEISSDSDVQVDEASSDIFAGIFTPEGDADEDKEQNDWSALLEKTEKPAEFGPELPADLAAALDRVSALQPEGEKIKSWKQKYVVPSNAKKLSAPVRLID